MILTIISKYQFEIVPERSLKCFFKECDVFQHLSLVTSSRISISPDPVFSAACILKPLMCAPASLRHLVIETRRRPVCLNRISGAPVFTLLAAGRRIVPVASDHRAPANTQLERTIQRGNHTRQIVRTLQ